MKNIISASSLKESFDDIILFDARNNFMSKEEGQKKYADSHIKNAFHLDLNLHLTSKIETHGGRDPLPEDMKSFILRLEECGVKQNSKIVIYDEDMMYASRVWWMCKYIGIENVKILNGGINAWIKEGYGLDSDTAISKNKGSIESNIKSDMRVDINFIKENMNNIEILLMDCRSESRYKGLNEPIDKKSGHIPNAKNYFCSDALDELRMFKSESLLKEHFKDLDKYKRVICYCGSGISANINILALDEIGIKASLYVGSFSDYITYTDLEIIKEI